MRGRWLAPVLVAAGIAVAAGCSGSTTSGWRTYRQSAGAVALSFRYPASWQVRDDFVVSASNGASLAELWTGLDRQRMMAADCAERGAALGAHGIFVTWGATLGSDYYSRLTQFRGQNVQVGRFPGRWSVQASTECFHGRIVTGVFQTGSRQFLIMAADVGSAVTTQEISILRTIFTSARGGT
jgi:hypothetical protein